MGGSAGIDGGKDLRRGARVRGEGRSRSLGGDGRYAGKLLESMGLEECFGVAGAP